MNAKDVTMDSIVRASRKFPTAGDMVWWSMAGVAMQHKALSDLLEVADFEDFTPALPAPRVALRRALKSWIKQRASGSTRSNYGTSQWTIVNDEEEKREIVNDIPDRRSTDYYVFEISEQTANQAKLSLRASTKIRIKVHKTTGIIVVTDTAEGMIDTSNERVDLGRQLDPHYQHYRTLHSGQDVSRTIKAIIDKNMWAVSLRYEGGVYFVPAGQDDKLRKLKTLVAALDHDPRSRPFFNAVGVMQDQFDTAQLALNAHDAMMGEVQQLIEGIDKLVKGETKVRDTTWADRMMKVQLINARASAYSELLGMNKTDIAKQLTKLQASVMELANKPIQISNEVTEDEPVLAGVR